jgi:hypothetical protein
MASFWIGVGARMSRRSDLMLAACCIATWQCAPTTDPPAPVVEFSNATATQFVPSTPPTIPVQNNGGVQPGNEVAGNAAQNMAATGGAGGMGGVSGGSSGGSTGMAGMSGAMIKPGTGGMPAMGSGGKDGSGTGGSVATGSGGAEASGPKPTKLSFEVTTKTQGGRYAPKNVGAIWIEDSSGKWVYTLEWWDSILNASKLSRYSQVQGPAYVAFFGDTPPADVITGATLSMHKSHSVTWSLKDSKGAEAPDGEYTLMVEVSEAEANGKTLELPFTKGPAPVTMTPADSPYYTSMTLTLQ